MTSEQKWTGWWIPANVAKLMLTGKISLREMVLLAIVDGMVDRSGESCFASNAALAEMLGCTKKYMEECVSKLKRMGLLIQVKFDGRRRFIEASYSRVNARTRKNPGTGPGKIRGLHPYTSYKGPNIKGDRTSRELTFARVCCQQLKDYLHRNTRVIAKWRIDKQVNEMKLLIKSVKDEGRFLDVFEWYGSNLMNRDKPEFKLPLCVNPKQLRQRWDWIEGKYDKLAKKQKDESVSVSDDAKAIAEELSNKHWPKGSEAALPKAIQLSLDEYRGITRKLTGYVKKHYKFDSETGDYKARGSNGKPIDRRILHLHQAIEGSRNFVTNWFRDLNRRVQNWKDWKGDLYNHRIKRPDVIHYMKQLVSDYTGSDTAIDSVLDEIGEA